MIQQGDVLLHREAIPSDLVPTDLAAGVVQHGEATGHKHALQGDGYTYFENPKTRQRYLRIVRPTALRHEEHKEIMLAPGDYRIGIVREYDYEKEESRYVAD